MRTYHSLAAHIVRSWRVGHRVAQAETAPGRSGNPSFTERVATARERLAKAQKPGAGVPAYMRWVNRRAARPVAAFAHAARISPNTITWISLALSAAAFAMLILAPRTGWMSALIAGLLAAAFVFDSADGQTARLAGGGSPSGEWLDHVVDSLRTPALHVVVAMAAWMHGLPAYLSVAALTLSLVVSTQFMSQILAEQLTRRAGATVRRGSTVQSWILLPTDPGIWAWSFLVWWSDVLFTGLYLTLGACAVLHSVVSLRRRYLDLSTPGV